MNENNEQETTKIDQPEVVVKGIEGFDNLDLKKISVEEIINRALQARERAFFDFQSASQYLISEIRNYEERHFGMDIDRRVEAKKEMLKELKNVNEVLVKLAKKMGPINLEELLWYQSQFEKEIAEYEPKE